MGGERRGGRGWRRGSGKVVGGSCQRLAGADPIYSQVPALNARGELGLET